MAIIPGCSIRRWQDQPDNYQWKHMFQMASFWLERFPSRRIDFSNVPIETSVLQRLNSSIFQNQSFQFCYQKRYKTILFDVILKFVGTYEPELYKNQKWRTISSLVEDWDDKIANNQASHLFSIWFITSKSWSCHIWHFQSIQPHFQLESQQAEILRWNVENCSCEFSGA